MLGSGRQGAGNRSREQISHVFDGEKFYLRKQFLPNWQLTNQIKGTKGQPDKQTFILLGKFNQSKI